ncbi:MAG: diaminopimelate decarboxylase [Chloroflexota bacterium]
METPFAVTTNDAGHLTVDGVDVVSLAERFGTPLYALSEGAVRAQCRKYREAMRAVDPRGDVVYAAKALLTTAVARILDEEGMHIDVVSGGELYTALMAGFPPERIHFNGNAKTAAEVEMAIRAGVGRIIIDNFAEIALVEATAAAAGRRVSAMIRVTPGVEAHTHEFIQTGVTDSKFGFNYVGGQAFAAAEGIIRSRHIDLAGVQCHLGSQILDQEPFSTAARIMVKLADEIRVRLGYVVPDLDMGGGLGVRYLAGDNPPPVADLMQSMASTIRAACAACGMPVPRLVVEPGRSIVAEAGLILYRVESMKEIPGIRRYVAVDGGMADNIRPALYDAKYSVVNASRMNGDNGPAVTVAGRCCESGDIVARDVVMPEAQIGDVLAVLTAGAYTFSMANNYNRLPRPAMVLIGDNCVDVIVERQTYQDLIAHDRIPARLLARAEAAACSERQ